MAVPVSKTGKAPTSGCCVFLGVQICYYCFAVVVSFGYVILLQSFLFFLRTQSTKVKPVEHLPHLSQQLFPDSDCNTSFHSIRINAMNFRNVYCAWVFAQATTEHGRGQDVSWTYSVWSCHILHQYSFASDKYASAVGHYSYRCDEQILSVLPTKCDISRTYSVDR